MTVVEAKAPPEEGKRARQGSLPGIRRGAAESGWPEGAWAPLVFDVGRLGAAKFGPKKMTQAAADERQKTRDSFVREVYVEFSAGRLTEAERDHLLEVISQRFPVLQ